MSGALVAVGLFAFLLYGWMSAGPITGVKTTMARQIRPEAAGHWWLLLSLPLLLAAVLIGIGVLRLGTRGAMIGLLLASVVGLLLLQVHDEWRLTYREGRRSQGYADLRADQPRRAVGDERSDAAIH